MSSPWDRRTALSLLAQAKPTALARHMEALGELPRFEWLRPPETGAVMLRGRASGTGAPFNLGEMTVTRCTLRLAALEGTDAVGHGTVAGRSHSHAERVALCDALLQTAKNDAVETHVLAPLSVEAAAARDETASAADKTKVNFFTLVRGED